MNVKYEANCSVLAVAERRVKIQLDLKVSKKLDISFLKKPLELFKIHIVYRK